VGSWVLQQGTREGVADGLGECVARAEIPRLARHSAVGSDLIMLDPLSCTDQGPIPREINPQANQETGGEEQEGNENQKKSARKSARRAA
jgi:hypothetical protein